MPETLELGDLKWTLYGVPRRADQQASRSIFSCLTSCMPCGGNAKKRNPQRLDPEHPAYKSGMKPHSGDLVRHDIYTCLLCRNAAGCPHVPESHGAPSASHSPSPGRRRASSAGGKMSSPPGRNDASASAEEEKKDSDTAAGGVEQTPRPVVTYGSLSTTNGEEMADSGMCVEVTSLLQQS